MKSNKVEIYVGALIEHESEKRSLAQSLEIVINSIVTTHKRLTYYSSYTHLKHPQKKACSHSGTDLKSRFKPPYETIFNNLTF